MKKRLLILLLIISTSSVCNAKYLIRLTYRYKLWVGHHVEMYFSEESLRRLTQRIQDVDSLEERALLMSFNLPIYEYSIEEEYCNDSALFVDDLSNLFSWGCKKKVITINTNTYFLSLELVKSEYSVCIFPLYIKLWGSYDCSFKKAVVLTSMPKSVKWNKDEIDEIKKLKMAIKNISSM